MTAILKVDTIQDTSGNNIINESSDTITIGASGDTIALAGTTVTGITQGITMADQYRVTANISSSADPISANLERIDTGGQGTLGTGMSLSSGRFTFPSSGIYLVSFNAYGTTDSDGDNLGMRLKVTTNNSSYATVVHNFDGNKGGQSISVAGSSLIDVTDTSNVKVSFEALSIDSGSYFFGDTTGTAQNETYFTFIRLGDT
jgi:hypothetical protein